MPWKLHVCNVCEKQGSFQCDTFKWHLWNWELLDSDSNNFTVSYSFCCIIYVIQMSFSFTLSHQGEVQQRSQTTQTREACTSWTRVSSERGLEVKGIDLLQRLWGKQRPFGWFPDDIRLRMTVKGEDPRWGNGLLLPQAENHNLIHHQTLFAFWAPLVFDSLTRGPHASCQAILTWITWGVGWAKSLRFRLSKCVMNRDRDRFSKRRPGWRFRALRQDAALLLNLPLLFLLYILYYSVLFFFFFVSTFLSSPM